MVHSMTAFARVEKAGAQGTLSWELRSVNSRYLEPHLRLPESFRDLEGGVREALRQGLSRGKLECTLRFTEESAGKTLQVDRERAAQLVAAAETVASLIKNPAALNPLEVLAWPGVLVGDASDPQALNAEAMALFNEGLKELKAGREREGAELARLINERLTSIEEDVSTLRELVPQMLATQRQKVLDRFTDMKAELDPQRLEQEMVMLAQKSDVAEELDRLSTHIIEVRRVLKSGGAAGRRLDFLMQELNREANTLGSKAFDPRSTQAAVNLKVLNGFDSSLDKIPVERVQLMLHEYRLELIEDLLEDIGLGNRMAYVVARRLLGEGEQLPSAEGPLAIRGTEGLVLSYAKCCTPIPGDPIVGHLSAGKGMVVHLDNCRNISEIRHNPEKCIQLSWAKDVTGEFNVELRVELEHQRGLIALLASSVNAADGNIEKISMDERDGRISVVQLVVSVHDRVHLARVIKKLRALTGVIRITRMRA